MSAAVGVVLILLGVWAEVLDKRFTPLYREVRCEQLPPRLDQGSSHHSGDFELHLVTQTVCKNPNPYVVTLESSRAGAIYVGQHRDQVAWITGVPKTTLPAGGEGTIMASVAIPISKHLIGGNIFSGIGFLFGAQFPIFVEVDMDILVDVNLIFGTFSTKRSFDRDCGLNVMLRNFQVITGQMACAKSFDALVLPDAKTTGHTGMKMDLAGGKVARKELDEGKNAKELGLGIAKAVGFGGGVLMICLAALCAFCPFRSCARAIKPAEPAEKQRRLDVEAGPVTPKVLEAETIGRQDGALPTLLKPSRGRDEIVEEKDNKKPAAEGEADGSEEESNLVNIQALRDAKLEV